MMYDTKGRYVLVDEGEGFFIVDKKDLKTLQDFIDEIIAENDPEDYAESEIKEMAEMEYIEYLSDKELSGEEITDLLNRLDQLEKKEMENKGGINE